MRWWALCLIAGLALPVTARAGPMAAGTCSALDDGWASRRPKGPGPIAMDLPTRAPETFRGPFAIAIVDLELEVGVDGQVSSVRLLCSAPSNPAFAAALLQSAAHWRFGPSPWGAQLVAYRVIVPSPESQWGAVRRVFLGAAPMSKAPVGICAGPHPCPWAKAIDLPSAIRPFTGPSLN
jgi:hypothetical protein